MNVFVVGIILLTTISKTLSYSMCCNSKNWELKCWPLLETSKVTVADGAQELLLPVVSSQARCMGTLPPIL